MAAEFPYASRPEDVAKLLKLLPEAAVPEGKIGAGYFKSLGFTPASGKHLFNILKILGFINIDKGEASVIWKKYAAGNQRGPILAISIKKAYPDLFELVFCPYLEEDDAIVEFLKKRVKASFRDIALMVQTFRILCEAADFQDIMCDAGPNGPSKSVSQVETANKVKVNPALQINLQIHIDPSTPDEKIEVIFKNMRKYLLEKG
jgi:hypothetical protein